MQGGSAPSRPAPSTALQSRGATAIRATSHGIYLVFPFQNAAGASRLDWLSEGLEELTIEALSSAGEQVYSHEGRLGQLERYGIPATAKLSRATMLHVAEDLDADFVVFGTFTSDGKNLTVDSRLMRVNPPSLIAPVRESGELNALMDLHTRLVWRMLVENDRVYPLSLDEFAKLHRSLRLDAFENYIRGFSTTDDETRLRELREAARLEPEWAEPTFALAEVYYAKRDCNVALPLYARVPKGNDRYAESLFASGVCRLLLNQPDRAEEIYLSLQTLLRTGSAASVDFPEVLNNLGVARARQQKFPGAQADLKRASALDPDEDDYPFNLGLIALRQEDFDAAAVLFREASQREPDIAEDRSLLIAALEKAGKKNEADQERIAATEAFGPNGLPAVHVDAQDDSIAKVERIKTELDPETLRFEMESTQAQAETAGSQELHDTPSTHLRKARQDLSAGLLDRAEIEYRSALSQDKGNAAAHLGLAEIARRQNKLDESVKELQASLLSRDSAAVRVTLARVYLEEKKIPLARAEAEKALKLAPNYSEARQLLEHLPGGCCADVPAKGGPQ